MPASNLPCVAKQCNMSFVKITQSDITNRFWNCSDSSKDSTVQFVTKPCFKNFIISVHYLAASCLAGAVLFEGIFYV